VTSHRDDLDVQSSPLRKRAQDVRIGRDDPIVVACEQDERGVDDVGLPRAAKEQARAAADVEVQGDDFDRLEKACDAGLSGAAAPDLADNAAVRAGSPPRQELTLQQGGDHPIAALEGDERPRIEDQLQERRPRARAAGDSARASAARVPRMVTARDRAVRAAFSISSFVITPCSASKSAMIAASSASPRSCSSLRRMASFTHALTLATSPRLAAASAATRRSASTDALKRCFTFIRLCYMCTTNVATDRCRQVRGRRA
jgi:hypothetical protein